MCSAAYREEEFAPQGVVPGAGAQAGSRAGMEQIPQMK
jgi:hypothetical protein